MAHNKLYRNFIILQEDENSHSGSDDKPLSGYAKIEAKSDKCKISFYAQNLNKNEKYSIVLICYKKEVKQIVNLGELEVNEVGKGEAVKEYYINDIAGLNFSYEKISGAAICKHRNDQLSFLMYGFMNNENIKDDWKKVKVVKCYDKNKSDHEYEKKLKEDIKDKDICKKEEDKLEKCLKEKHKHDDDDDKMCSHDDDKKDDKEKPCKHHHDDDDEKDCKEEKDDDEHKHHKDHDDDDEKDEEKHHKHKEDYGCDEKCTRGDAEEEDNSITQKDFDAYEETVNRIKEEQEIDPYDFQLRGAIGDFFSNIVKGFEEVKGKFKEIKYCKWYKVKIGSIDDMCNTSDYNKYTIAYYPMLNYYPYIKKYGYFFIGYKCDLKGDLKYIVYGVPGNKDKDEQPYVGKTGFVTWVGSEDEKVGCWLMFYDYKNSNVVVPMK